MSNRMKVKVGKFIDDEIAKYGLDETIRRQGKRNKQVSRGLDIAIKMLVWMGASLVFMVSFNMVRAGIYQVTLMVMAAICTVVEVFYIGKWVWNYRPLKELQ